MLLMVKNGVGGGIRHALYRYAEASNTYRKDYD